jgi:undecaprenyl-phosphate galactose phosphotransferase
MNAAAAPMPPSTEFFGISQELNMPTARRYPSYKYVLAVVDWCTIVSAHGLAFVLEARWLDEHFPTDQTLIAAELVYIALLGVAAVLIFHYLGLYQVNVFVTIVQHSVKLIKGLAALVVSIAVLSFLTKAEFIVDSRLLTLYFAASALGLLLIVRVGLFRRAYLVLSRTKFFQRNALILGAGDHGREVAVNLFLHDYTGVRVVGFLDDEAKPGTPIFNGVKVVGRTSDIRYWVRTLDVKEILVCLEKIEHAEMMALLEQIIALNVIVKISSPLYEIVSMRRSIERYGHMPVLSVFQSSISSRREYVKRAFDVVAAALMVVLLLPLLLFIALIIKLDSPGPVFFRQVRVGKHGRNFTLLKFRSMTAGPNDDEERKKQMADFIKSKRKVVPGHGESTKIVNEARITPVGKWLRKLSLDELPQLFNVLKGDMSLVGPRPCLPYEWEQYADWHKRRLSVLPGLTGMWQVTGRSLVGFEDMVVLDLHYIQNASLFLDLRVILKTIPVVFLGTGAK